MFERQNSVEWLIVNADIMRRDDHRLALTLQAIKELSDKHARSRIDCVEWFIEQKQVRSLRNGTREKNALLLSA
jgi:hypothetical protein